MKSTPTPLLRNLVRLGVPGLLLALGLLFTLGAWKRERSAKQGAVQAYFDYRSRDAVARIEARLRQYEQALLAARGLFQASAAVTHSGFATFVASLEVTQRYPGIQGIGFSLVVPPAELDRHILKMRRLGFPEYSIRPAGERACYSSIIYLEPFKDRNLRAFGYDMFSEPVRQVAMRRATDSSDPALSGKVQLVQETDQDIQAGFLLYVPVYRNGRATQTVGDRRRNLLGWIYAPFRMNDFMRGVLGEGEPDLELEIFDGPGAGAEAKMFDRDPARVIAASTLPQARQTLSFAGHSWTVATQALPGLITRHGQDTSSRILGLGTLVSLLLGLTVFLLARHLAKIRSLNATLEQKVQDRTQRLASIISGTNVGTWEWNVQTGETLFNERWANIIGYTLDELSPVSIKTWGRFAHPQDLKASGELLQKHFQGDLEFYDFETRMKHKDGTWVWVHDRGRVSTWTEDGKPLLMMGTHTDITERKEAEAVLARVKDQTHQLQKAESLGLMAASIAHHFNNKLQAVMANLDLLSALPKGGDPTKHLAEARLASEKAAAVSRQLLAYLGNTPGARAPLCLGDLCAASQPLLQQALPAGVTLASACRVPGPTVKANAEQVQQVLTNLVTNAGEAMGAAGGCVRLSLSCCPAAELPTDHRFPIDWQPQGPDYACLEVADTGAGIASADIGKLFDPFYSTKFTGRGLGLSVVLGLVQAHGGAITVASQPGQGSVFRVYLPVSTEATPRRQERAVQAPALSGGGTLLVVEDDDMLLLATGALVELLGFTLLAAKDGVEALELFRQHRAEIRCVLTDLTMPRLDGWGLLTALRQLDPSLPVILASGYDQAQVLAGTRAHQPQAFLSKPYGLPQLRAAVHEALAARAAPGDT